MREFSHHSALSEEWKQKLDVYEKVHQGTNAYETSLSERNEKDLQSHSEFVYGEVVFLYFVPLLEYTKPKPGEVFLDLGCGAGKPLVTASLAFPEL